ncbi:hypothetical protein M409DRAFT_53337 [Zasmidium cellare ATCC 36951]|uniref:Uncharacterized protein n=1 Tax=Zasmidium cellare ATCC 36951 TaxID=1080233 RepID=A0A6A6CQ98_ZASCE|nr:uncharacterized protein M409DRAFT_53337 [Zasmidium cellare ATCC 36951]KAF2168002.1 hypothetical protein M409DRAFT_53337 [Zasmidium cellare ATCC 36951]
MATLDLGDQPDSLLFNLDPTAPPIRPAAGSPDQPDESVHRGSKQWRRDLGDPPSANTLKALQNSTANYTAFVNSDACEVPQQWIHEDINQPLTKQHLVATALEAVVWQVRDDPRGRTTWSEWTHFSCDCQAGSYGMCPIIRPVELEIKRTQPFTSIGSLKSNAACVTSSKQCSSGVRGAPVGVLFHFHCGGLALNTQILRSKEDLAMGIANAIVLYDKSKVQATKQRNRDVLLYYMRARIYYNIKPDESVRFRRDYG